MKEEDKYLKAIKALKSNRPLLKGREQLTDDIMRTIGESSDQLKLREKLVYYLFGWVNIYWLRGAMTVTAVLFAGFFIVQQLIMADRLEKLEKQSVRIENVINGHETGFGLNQRILVNSFLENKTKEDSITVSTHDLEELVNNYWKLLRKYENRKQTSNPDHYNRKRIKSRSELKTKNDET